MRVEFRGFSKGDNKVLVVPVFEYSQAPSLPGTVNRAALADILLGDPKFRGKAGQTLIIPAAGTGVASYTHIVALGMGSHKDLTEKDCDNIGSALFKALSGAGFAGAELEGFGLDGGKIGNAETLAHIANGAMLASYNTFDKYKKKTDQPELGKIVFLTKPDDAAARAFAPLQAVIDGVFFARDLANEPPNILYPDSFAKRIQEEFKDLPNIKITVLDEDLMQMKGMGALLGVAKGSPREPRMVIMEYDGLGRDDKSAPLALVGKGVTFDAGGISIKPGANMDEMKFDMGGSAAVAGAMLALAKRGAKARVVGAVGLVENMPDGNAYRPGDILTAMDGTTIEILNTDAEGRLVLADTLTYVGQTYQPHTMIDLATLTGACVAALGHTMAGVFTRDDKLAKWIEQAGRAVQEENYRLPLHESFERAIKGTYADLQNLGGPYAGASTAAHFVLHFNKAAHAAHIDIAGMAWNAPGPLRPDKIGTGYGVMLLDRLIKDRYEEKGICTQAPSFSLLEAK